MRYSLSLLAILSFSAAQRLIQSHAIFRHGDRAPTSRFSSKEAAAYFFRGIGQLSDQGLTRAHYLGKKLRKRTVEAGLLDKRMLPTEVNFHSSIVPRCLMSAVAVGTSMFDKVASNPTLPTFTPVATQRKNLDFLCFPQCNKLLLANMSATVGLQEVAKDLNAIMYFHEQQNALKSEYFKDKERNNFVEALPIEKDVGLAVPKWFNSSAELEAQRLMYEALSFINGVGKFYNNFWIRCRIGRLLDKISTDIQKAVDCTANNCSKPFAKFNAYSTHDLMLMPLMEAVGLYKEAVGEKVTPFSSCLLIEVWMVNDLPQLKLLFYNGRQDSNFKDYTVSSKGCSGLAYCPISNFINATTKYRLAEAEIDQCGFDSSAVKSSSTTSATVLLLSFLCSLFIQ